jgi:hypothetical protein
MSRHPHRAHGCAAPHAVLTKIAAALAGTLLLATAHAEPTSIDFESVTNVVTPALAAGDTAYNTDDAFRQAGFTLQVRNNATAAADDYGLVGALVDGADPFGCYITACPTGNASTWFAGLNDGALDLSRDDHLAFTVDGLQFAFIGPVGGLPNLAFGQLALTGTLAGGGTVTVRNDFPGQGSAGSFRFDQFLLGGFGANALTRLRIDACLYDANGGCSFDHLTTQNQAQFAIDNVQLSLVPEPAALTMLMVGLAALALTARRRA